MDEKTLNGIIMKTMTLDSKYPLVYFDGFPNTIEYDEKVGLFFMKDIGGNPVYFNMNNAFFNYLHTSTLKGFVNASVLKKMFENKEYQNLTGVINTAKTMQNHSGKKKTSNRFTYYAAIVNGEIYALLCNYVPLHNMEVLNMINEVGLMDNIQHCDSTNPELLEVFLKSQFKIAEKYEDTNSYDFNIRLLMDEIFSFGVVVRNGMTGINSLSYEYYVSVGSMPFNTYSFPIYSEIGKGKSKHLNNLSATIREVEKYLSDVALQEFADNIPNFSKEFSMKIVKEIFGECEQVDNLEVGDKIDNMFEVICALWLITDAHGYKIKSRKAIQKLIEESAKIYFTEKRVC